MFTYCSNNPVNLCDQNGACPSNFIGPCPGKASCSYFKNNSFFGAGSTLVNQSKQETELSPTVVNLFVTVKSGTKQTSTLVSKGDSSRPISVYAQGRSDNSLLSSVGIKINISSFTLNVSWGLDNIGISGSVKRGDTTNSFGITTNLSQLKVGFEGSKTVKWDANNSATTYTNASITGMGIIAAACLVTTGSPSPQFAY